MFALALPLIFLVAPMVAAPTAPALSRADSGTVAEAVEGALDLLHHGRRLAAQDALISLLSREIRPDAAIDARRAAELEVGALLLSNVVAQLDSFADVGPILRAQAPWPASTPPRVGFLLDRLVAECWRRVGRSDRARGVLDPQGLRSDWWIAGPFDNERGTGFDVAYPPESDFDWEAPLDGKEREIMWRLNRARAHPLGVVELHEMMRPRTQAIAYAASGLNAGDAGPVVLRLGTTGSFKVFLNGEEVASRKVERPLHMDQERIVLHLNEGWNQLLLKLSVEEGAWAFGVRFTRIDGSAADEVIMDSLYTSWPEPAPSVEAASLLLYTFPEAEEELNLPSVDGVEIADDGGESDLATRYAAFQGQPGIEEFMALKLGLGPDGPWPRAVPSEQRLEVALGSEAIDVLGAATEDASAQRLLALYHLLVHPADQGNLPMRAAAERAVELAPESTLAWYLLARSHEADGRARNEIAVNDRLAALDEVLARDPEHVAALLDRARFALGDAPRPDAADELSRRAAQAAPEFWDALVLRAAVLDGQGRRAEAEALRREAELIPEAATISEALLAAASRVRLLGNPERYAELLQVAFQRNILSSRLADAFIESAMDRDEIGLALWATQVVLNARPVDTERMRRTASAVEHGEPYDLARARELVLRSLDVCPHEAKAWKQLARMALRGELRPLALFSLERALELDPSYESVRQELELLTAEQREAFELPFRWDASELLATPLPESDDEPLEVLRRTVVWRVREDGTEDQYRHMVVRVLTEGGARMLDSYRLAAPGAHDLDVLTMRILRADGESEPIPAPRRRRGTARLYDLPSLDVGDLLDVEFRADQHRADVFGEYFGLRHIFFPEQLDATAPTRLSELILLAPPEVPLHVAERRAELLERDETITEEGLVMRRWVARDLERPALESGMPPLVELAPVVDVTTFSDWDAFARWWWSFIEKEFVTTPAMSSKVQELVAGTSDELGAIEAITRFVAQDIRYNAWAFGTHGYEPYSAATIFERRFGDCKDKSILLRQMLAEIGVEAWPVLIRAQYGRAEEPLGAAMVGAFNHCITYVPGVEGRPGVYLDATADRNPIDYLRADDQGARVLHVRPSGGELHDIPYAPADENAFRRSYRVTLDAEGGAEVRMEDHSSGSFAVRLRSVFGGEQGDLEALLGRELREAFGQVDVLEATTSTLDDIAEEVELIVRFVTRDLGIEQGRNLSLPIHFDELGLAGLADETVEQREHALVLDRPLAHEQTLIYELPPETQRAQLVEPVSIEVPGLLDYELSSERVGDELHVRRLFRLHERRIALDRYAEFREALQRVRQAESRRLQLDLPRLD